MKKDPSKTPLHENASAYCLVWPKSALRRVMPEMFRRLIEPTPDNIRWCERAWEPGRILYRSLPSFPKAKTTKNPYGVVLRMPRDWPEPRWLEASPENIRLWKRAWRHREAKRIRECTPSWANKQVIRAIYGDCRERSRKTGIPHHVDHIVPLRGGLVCGLHVENNLAIVPAGDNLKKGASHEPSHVENFLLHHPRPANEGDQRFLNWSVKLAQAEWKDWWDRLSPDIKHQLDLAQEARAWREITKKSKQRRRQDH